MSTFIQNSFLSFFGDRIFLSVLVTNWYRDLDLVGCSREGRNVNISIHRREGRLPHCTVIMSCVSSQGEGFIFTFVMTPLHLLPPTS